MRFGEWEIIEQFEIAGGGFDALAVDPGGGKEVRLWVGAPGYPAGEDVGSAIEALKTRLARVYHASLPRVLAAGVVDGRAFLKVQAYRGSSLAERLADDPPDRLAGIDLSRSIGAALVKAHAAGVIHGAIDEREIFLGAEDRPLLLHLGFGPFLEPRAPRAPEDLEAPGGSETADVFGLSRVLVRCVTGEDPYYGGLEATVGPSAADFSPDLPEGLRRFLERAVRPSRDGRLHRAEELAGDLGVIRASWNSLADAKEPVILPIPALLRRRNLLLAGLAVAAGIILALRGCVSPA